MKHFLEIDQLTAGQIQDVLNTAGEYKQSGQFPQWSNYSMANLFYENSTRTRVSFELAAKRLGLSVINLDIAHSSEQKGEALEDTLQTLVAMGINVFTIRHAEAGMVQHLADKFGSDCHFLNAGDGAHAHPSQAMLDMMTILEQKPDLARLKIAVVGDILHSRVASSFQCLCKKLKVGELVMVSPKIWQPKTVHYGTVSEDLHAIADADVVMTLRVQRERLCSSEAVDFENYRQHYAITQQSLKMAKPDALVMHPGPMNRGIEIDSDVADGSQSVILNQVNNGIWVRMAIINAVLRQA